MQMEKEWVKRPVIRLDMSRAGAEPETLRSYLDITFDRLEKEYDITPKPTAKLADRFDGIIQTSYEQTGQQVAILIDEYDSPLQHSWKTPHHEACTDIYREVLPFSKLMINTRSLFSLPVLPSLRRFLFSLYSTI